MPLPEAFQLGREAFDRRQFFMAHEHWETVWRAATPDARPFYRALIRIAAGCLKIEQQEYAPARRLLIQAQEGLLEATAVPEIDVATLRRQVRVLQERLEDLGQDRLAEFDPGWYPTIAPR